LPELLVEGRNPGRVALVFNPMSGMRSGESRRGRLEQVVRAAGLECDLAETDIVDGARVMARQAVRDGVERLLVSGGDGTLSDAADVLAGTDVTMAVIPSGTGNLLATNLGIPLDLNAAVHLALTGPSRRIDVGRANGHVFLIVAGIGADARMIRDADRELKQRFGALAYFIAAWRNFGQPLGRYRITIDGRRISRRAQTVMVANLGRITGGVELIPGSDPLDGKLEIAIVRMRTLRHAIMVAVRSLLGRHQNDNLTEIRHGRHIIIETDTPQPAEVDGDEIGTTRRLEVFVEPGALRIVLPDHPIPVFPDPAQLMTEVTNRPALLPVALGLATTAAAILQRRRQNAQHKPTNALTRNPLLVGLAAGALAMLVVDQLRNRDGLDQHTSPNDGK